MAALEKAVDPGLLCASAVSLVRVDERLGAASAAVRAGWLARASLHEASATARLDEAFADAHDLLLVDHDALDRLVDRDTQRAHQALQMLRAASRRSPRQLFTPRRLLAAARLRLRDRGKAEGYPSWLDGYRNDLAEIQEVLGKALDPQALSDMRRLPAVQGAAEFVVRWHRSGAGALLGGAPGRALACAWVRRVGLVREAVFMPAIGFLGRAADYRPDEKRSWPESFFEAAIRSAEWQLELLQRLNRLESRIYDWAKPQRSTSRLPALADLVISMPAISARSAAERLGVTPVAARRLLQQLEHAKLVRETTGRSAFRLYTEF